MSILTEGEHAPAFTLPIDGGGTLDSATLAGAPYVLYFYPKDNTPGCTTQACSFRDNIARVSGAGAKVIGVSTDSVARHDKFVAKFDLPFPLVADTERTLHDAYGTWGPKKMAGREYMGTYRSTFLIGADGVIAKAWPKTRVKGHVDAVLEALEAL